MSWSSRLFAMSLPAAFLFSVLPLPATIAATESGMSRKEELHRYLYHIYVLQKRYPEAEKEVVAVSSLAPRDARIQGEFGRKLFDDKLLKLAYPHMVKATQLDPYTAAYWANRGACETQLGRYNDAVESFKKAVQFQKGQENYGPQLQQLQQYNQHLKEQENYKRMEEQRKKDEDE